MRHFSITYMQWQAHIAIFYSLYPSPITYLSPYTFQRTSALSLSAIRNPRSQLEWLVSGTSLPHSSPQRWILCYISPDTSLASLSARAVCSPSCSFPLYRPLFVGPKRRRWRLITTQSSLPVRPGLRPVPRKPATAFCRPGAFTTAVPVLQNQQSSSCVPRKKRAPLSPVSRPLFAKSPEGRPNVRLLASGESIAENSRDSTLAEPYRGTRKACIKCAEATTPCRHDTARNANGWKEVYFRIISPYEWWTFCSETCFESILSCVMRVYSKNRMRRLLE